MVIVLFFSLAFLTVFLSIRLSILSDCLSKNSNVSKAVIGGILLAGVTALPELVTCISSIVVGNPLLAMGDVFGSNFFNIFMVCFFDLVFLKVRFFNKLRDKHYKIYLFLIINYIFILLSMSNVLSKTFIVGIPSLVIIFTYFWYLLKLEKNDDVVKDEKRKIKYLKTRLVLVSIFLVIFSSMLTFTVDRISVLYPSFSSSILGAVLLGVTTSLPEVITFYTLFKLENYDVALSDIIGSNLFNLLVLAIGDFALKGKSKMTKVILVLCIFVSFLGFLQVMRKRVNNWFLYGILSMLVVIIYGVFWYLNFVL